MTPPRRVTRLIFAAAAFGAAAVALAQQPLAIEQRPPAASQPAPGILSSAAFDAWVATTRRRLDAAHAAPTELADTLLARLRDSRATSTAAILETVHAVRSHEVDVALATVKLAQTIPLPATKRFIAAVLPLVRGDVRTEGQLYLDNARTLEQEGDFAAAAAEARRAADTLRPLSYEIEFARMTALHACANDSALTDQPARAEAACLELLSYDWPKVRDAELFHRFKDLYVSACRLLIDLRRHDVAALQGTFFLPNVTDQLGPRLREVTAEAMRETSEREATPPPRPAR